MKLTKRQLRKLISESFIGAPDGTVYTPKTKKVHNRYYSSYPNRPLMDVPAVYGEDDTQVATPRLYSFLTRNRDEIHNFHEKGPKVYKAIMDPKEDPETKMQFLTLLQSYGIITDKELEDIQLDLDLLTSPDFAEFRRLGAERLKKMAAEPFGENEGVEKANLYKNPHYVEWAKKQIDKAVDGGFEYFKDAIEEQFFYHMHDHKRQKLSNFDYNPDEGIYPENFASLYIYEIGGLLGAYKGFRSTEDAAYYNTDLDDYTNDKSHDMIIVAIDALVGAGILEKTADSKVRMPIKTYQIMLNNEQGRKEDFYKEQGTQSAFLDDPYVSNPNLPVVTEAMIRQMIREATFVGQMGKPPIKMRTNKEIYDTEDKWPFAVKTDLEPESREIAMAADTVDPRLKNLYSQPGGKEQAYELASALEMLPDNTEQNIEDELAGQELISHSDFENLRFDAGEERDNEHSRKEYNPYMYELETNPISREKLKQQLPELFASKMKWYKEKIMKILYRNRKIKSIRNYETPSSLKVGLDHIMPDDIKKISKASSRSQTLYRTVNIMHWVSIEKALNELIDEGMIERVGKIKSKRTPVKITDKAYNHYEPGDNKNTSLPVVTEEVLRRLIAEALDEGSRIIVDPEGKATVASDDYRTGTAKDAQTKHPRLMTLRQSGLEGQRQARQLAVDLDMQPELTTAEETAVEMGEWKAIAPDLQFHNELPGTKSIEFSQYLKRECEKRGLACTVEDARHKKPNKPYIVVSIEGGHPLRYEDINAVVYINDTWMKELEIDIRAYYPDAPAGVKKERRGVLTPRNTRPYTSGTYGENGLEQLAELVVDALSEL